MLGCGNFPILPAFSQTAEGDVGGAGSNAGRVGILVAFAHSPERAWRDRAERDRGTDPGVSPTASTAAAAKYVEQRRGRR